MTLHFEWLHVPRWLKPGHLDRAMTLVLAVIGVSVLFGALRVLDVAFSGGLALASPAHPALPAVLVPVDTGSPISADRLIVSEPSSAGAQAVEVNEVFPQAAVDAISL